MGGMDLGLQPVGQTVKKLGFQQSKVGCRKRNGSGLNIVGFNKLGISFGDNIGSHVNEGMMMALDRRIVLDLEKHLVIVFKENSKPFKRKILGVNGDNGSRKEAYIPKVKGLIYKSDTSRSGRKLNRTIRNHGDNFKSVGTIHGKLKEVSSFKANKIIANMGFQFSNKVEAIDFFGGIWKRRKLWESLKDVILIENTPWMAIDDFNALISSSDKK
ncbi:hypothetical protein Goshw_009509 [Gossypium schwendimanii]|uniref:Uncharacterized protein n=1 Tax=Gossypium schwendimanii TaxID=34291 RepID=A0A7J9KWX3_GOSSC|nr:hypothetical protein [Gossypium schwendimanii]